MSKRLVIIIGAILISLLFFFFLFFKKNSVYNLSNFNSSNIEIENDIPNPFLIAAIIDNHPDARPQFGLSQASMVFDVPVEGGITRFLAFFPVNLSEDFKIGPIRSLRPYFLDIALEYQALLLHCGGSPEALARVVKEEVKTFNEFYDQEYFSRYSSYQAPHNILASYTLISEYLNKENFLIGDYEDWTTKKPESNYFTDNSSIEIKRSGSQYNISWIYDFSQAKYRQEKTDLEADNIIIRPISTKVLDDDLRLEIGLIGRGEAIICQDSYCQEVVWEKKDKDDQTRYYFKDGRDFVFNIGKTWIHFIDQNSSFSIKNW